MIKGNRYYVVDLRRAGTNGTFRNFTEKEKALEFARSVGDKVIKSGLDGLTALDPRIKQWTDQFAVYGVTVDQGMQLAFDLLEKERKAKESPFVSGWLSNWILDKTEDKLKPLRPRTAKEIRVMGNKFKTEWGEAKVTEMTDEFLDQYIRNLSGGNQRKKNVRNYAVQFFNYMMKKKVMTHNPAEHIEIHVQNGAPEYYTVEECQKILKALLTEENKCLIPYYALCLFGGVRPMECELLEWKEHVKLDTKEVYIPAAISKTKRDRIFTMSANLVAWLEFAKDVKPLIPANLRKLKEAAQRSIKKVEWITDGLRHTFATFHYAKHRNLEELRGVMGNSPNVIEKFYKGAISQTEVEKFWNLTPAVVAKAETKTKTEPPVVEAED